MTKPAAELPRHRQFSGLFPRQAPSAAPTPPATTAFGSVPGPLRVVRSQNQHPNHDQRLRPQIPARKQHKQRRQTVKITECRRPTPSEHATPRATPATYSGAANRSAVPMPAPAPPPGSSSRSPPAQTASRTNPASCLRKHPHPKPNHRLHHPVRPMKHRLHRFQRKIVFHPRHPKIANVHQQNSHQRKSAAYLCSKDQNHWICTQPRAVPQRRQSSSTQFHLHSG